jgi:hypothetical protein
MAMERLARMIPAAFVGAAGVLLAAMPLQAQAPRVSQVGTQARLSNGSITGTVHDDRGAALAGAMVSALGTTLASTVTDDRGHFSFSELPAGDYLLRAHMIGFVASTGTRVRAGISPSVHFQLRRVDTAVGTAGASSPPVRSRPIIAAGFDLPTSDDAEAEPAEGAEGADHPHDETAWRLRHLTRSVLKSTAPSVFQQPLDAGPEVANATSVRATVAGPNLAASLFSGFPLSGEVNFLTTGAAAPGQLLSATAWPRGVAYLALAAPGSGGDWSMRAAMSEGDLSSWIVAGAFASKLTRVHAYDFGASYSTQEYQGGNPAALLAVTDGRRNVGELYALDRWRIRKPLTVEYGARYAHYDYLDSQGMLSPKVGVTLQGSNGRIRTTVAQRMVAPGAEEFLATNARGPWIPPERTFAPLATPGDLETFRVERARWYDVTLERDIGGAFVLGISRYYQAVDDQLVTLFGMQLPGGPQSVGHYYVGNAGSVNANGWAFAFGTNPESRIQGSVKYSVTRAHWSGATPDDLALLAPLAPAAIRTGTEDIHDLTSTVKADITETATRVFVLYKLNSGYVRSNTALEHPGLDGRFDVQVNQAIPVAFAGTRWEVLVGLRNLFRDPMDPASVYDELLVVRPPKRIVGGVLVKF